MQACTRHGGGIVGMFTLTIGHDTQKRPNLCKHHTRLEGNVGELADFKSRSELDFAQFDDENAFVSQSNQQIAESIQGMSLAIPA